MTQFSEGRTPAPQVTQFSEGRTRPLPPIPPPHALIRERGVPTMKGIQVTELNGL